MGMIGRWIDERCKAEPDVMRRVLNRKFGKLHKFLDGDRCGCLVGSYAIERDDDWVHGTNRSPVTGPLFSVGVRVERMLYHYTPQPIGKHGRLTTDPEKYKRPDAFVIRLLKQRIRKALGIAPENRPAHQSENVVGVGVGEDRPAL